MSPYTKILSSTNPLGWNCVFFARSKVPSLPTGLWTLTDKIKIITNNVPRVGSVAIIRTNQIWGHVAVVTYVGKMHLTIQEGNFQTGKITERHDTKGKLRIVGYFRPR